MNARHWSDAWGTLRELADRLALCVDRAPVVGFASMILRGQLVPSPNGGYAATAERITEVANDLRDHAELIARRYGYGFYEDHAALVDAADALDELAAPDAITQYYTDRQRVPLVPFVDPVIMGTLSRVDLEYAAPVTPREWPKPGAYILHTDGTHAFIPEKPADDGIVTGEFRAIKSRSGADGISVTEYEGEDTARYVSVDHGRSDQPPELVRVWAADPDDVEPGDDGTPL